MSYISLSNVEANIARFYEHKWKLNKMEDRDKKKETILVVEDVPEVMTVVTNLLEMSGYSTFRARNGEEAIRLFKENQDKIDMVLLDVILPGIGGKEVYRHIHQMASNIPFVINTGTSVQNEDIVYFEQQGLQVIRKPYSMDVLEKSIKRALDPPKSDPTQDSDSLHTN